MKGDGRSTYDDAERYLTHAIDGLRGAGIQYCLPLALLARAELYRRRGKLDIALNDLTDADQIAARYGRLLKCDVCLETCRLLLAARDAGINLDFGRLVVEGLPGVLEGDNLPLAAIWRLLEEARRMIDRMGYHRRDPEVTLVTAHLQILEGRNEKARDTLAAAKKLIDSMGCHRWDTDLGVLHERLA